jgi:hypothetical protein
MMQSVMRCHIQYVEGIRCQVAAATTPSSGTTG